MDTANIIFGIVGLSSFAFSIYSHFNSKSKREIEAAKVAMQKERYRNVQYLILPILHTVDSIVQIPKKGESNIKQLQHLARIARAQIVALSDQMKLDQKKLERWQYGRVVESKPSD